MQQTELQQFRITKLQKQTLKILHNKYGINTSQFIRDAISEKLQRDKMLICEKHSKLRRLIAKLDICPF